MGGLSENTVELSEDMVAARHGIQNDGDEGAPKLLVVSLRDVYIAGTCDFAVNGL